MGKIGDLFVRLGLKSDDYKKGIDEAKKENQGFGSSLGKMKAGAIAVWAAIGTAVTKFTKDFIASTNASADAWEAKVNGMKAGWQSLLADIQNSNQSIWDVISNITDPKKRTQNLFRRMFKAEAAKQAAEEVTEAFDGKFELENSVRLQRLAVQQELNELYVTMRDTTMSAMDRKAAADRYKAILQPIVDAEIKMYGGMLETAISGWQKGLSNRSTEEVIEFFEHIGTEAEAMKEKFPDLYDIFQNYKNDELNQPIFDIIAAYKQANIEMSNIEKEMGRTMTSIKTQLGESRRIIDETLRDMSKDDYKVEIEIDFEVDEELDDIDEEIRKFLDDWSEKQRLNEMLENSLISSFSGVTQAITDAAMGIEGAGLEQVMAALMQPLANMCTQLGEMLIATGVGIEAFKTSLKSLDPAVALTAGITLVALGAALSSGIRALGTNSGASVATTSSAAASTPDGEIYTYDQEITVNVVGRIAGSDILLSGSKTQNKWNR